MNFFECGNFSLVLPVFPTILALEFSEICNTFRMRVYFSHRGGGGGGLSAKFRGRVRRPQFQNVTVG